MTYRFLPDVAIADIAFEAYGKRREELFENCALALTSAMADLGKILPRKSKKIAVEGKNDEELLYNFLEELVYIKDVEGLLFSKFAVKLGKGKLGAYCSGDLLGKIGRENLLNDVKAITMHMFKIVVTAKGWKATVVVDI